MASPVAKYRLRTRRLNGHGSRAQPLRGMWDLPAPGHEPVSPASAGGLSTTAPPGKPSTSFFDIPENARESLVCLWWHRVRNWMPRDKTPQPVILLRVNILASVLPSYKIVMTPFLPKCKVLRRHSNKPCLCFTS